MRVGDIMDTDEKQAFVNEAEQAYKHPLVKSVVQELLFNLRAEGDALVSYGIHKVANAVAIVARCQALGIDPEELRMTDEEIATHMERMAQIALEAGKLIMVVPRA
jgi:UDP-N-acetylmuramyl tripeptide synthase